MRNLTATEIPLVVFSVASVGILFIVTFGFGLYTEHQEFVVHSHLVFSSVCHQNSVRSMMFSGVQLPVCGRCLGIYSGLSSSLIFLGIMLFHKKLALSTEMVRFLIVGVSLFLLLEVLLEMLGLIHVSNEFRFATGLIFGISVVVFLFSIKKV